MYSLSLPEHHVTQRCVAISYDGETYDARKEMPGWDVAGFAEDAAWSPAPVIADGPRGKMVASSMPPVALDKVVKPIGITNPAPGMFIVDYGTNVAGWSVIKNMKCVRFRA